MVFFDALLVVVIRYDAGSLFLCSGEVRRNAETVTLSCSTSHSAPCQRSSAPCRSDGEAILAPHFRAIRWKNSKERAHRQHVIDRDAPSDLYH